MIKFFKHLIIGSTLFFSIDNSSIYCQSNSTISVDLANPTANKTSVAGFLHFNNLDNLNMDIVSLRPKYWRVGTWLYPNEKNINNENLNVLIKNGITPILVVSDLIKVTPKNNNLVWSLKANNVQDVEPLVKQAYATFGNKVIYDLWNEPNLKMFWMGDNQEAFLIMKKIYSIIRSQNGGENAIITAPSIAGFNKNYLNQFLKFCSKNNMRIDILNWHQNGDVKDAFVMQQNIKYAKSVLIPEYSSVGIKDVYIPEVTSHKDQFNPLTLYAYLWNAEYAGASGICKSCWENSPASGGRTCWNNSMDGIMDVNGEPRATWWVYKFYAESLAKRIAITCSSFNNIITTSYLSTSGDTLNVLVGNTSSSPTSMSLNLGNVNKIIGNKRVNVDILKVPNSGVAIVHSPLNSDKKKLKVNHNKIVLNYTYDNSSVYLLKFY